MVSETARHNDSPRRRAAVSTVLIEALSLALVGVAPPARADAAGEVRWFDLLTEDADAAKKFYAKLFGWRFKLSPTGSYTALRRGTPIAGISQIEDTLPEEDESMWLAAIVVSDLEATVEAARRLGATVHEDVTRVPGYGSYAVIEDPQGAPVTFAVTERPLGGKEGPGAWIWAELWTDDVEASSRFYTEVVGYERSEVYRDGTPYSILLTQDEPRAGMVAIPVGEDIEPDWAPYLGVDDVGKTMARARKLGGRVLLEPRDDIGDGRIAVIADPTGAVFFVYQLEEEGR